MTVIASTAVLGLAWFAAVNAVVSVICWLWCRRLGDAARGDVRRTRMLVVLRLLPSATAAIVACALFAPAHLRLEPANADERYGILLALAGTAIVLMLRSSSRLVAVACTSWRLARTIRRRQAETRGMTAVQLPLFDGIALVGIFRPRLLIGSAARRALTAAELEIAIAHEAAHRRAGDNLTRVLMFVAPDFLGFTRAAGRIERLWAAEAECLADARAVDGQADRAQHLASALIKVARLGRVKWPTSPAYSLFHEPALLEARIRLLVACPAAAACPRSFGQLAIGSVALVAAAWLCGVPQQLHVFTEVVLSRLT